MPERQSLTDLSHDPDPVKAAQTALSRLKISGDAREALWPAVLNYFRDQRRAEARQVERSVAEAMRQGTPARVALTAPALLRQGFTLPDRVGLVLWATATVADHEERIAFLQRKVAGIDATISLHRKAIDRIQAAGVTCLADLEERAA